MIAFLACAPLLIWAFLILGRGFFWLSRERDDREQPPEPAIWPSVRAVVPARDEADVIALSAGSLLAQDYPGDFGVILVDDNSEDGTAAVAVRTAGRAGTLTVLRGQPLPVGWTGKLWAMKQGVEAALGETPSGTLPPQGGKGRVGGEHAGGDEKALETHLQSFSPSIVERTPIPNPNPFPIEGEGLSFAPPKYLLLTDADIAHAPDNLRRLVARAEARGLVLTSLMAKLSCVNEAERLLIPAFVYFFALVYPFSFVNNPRNGLGGAAGGCMLVRADALQAAGGVEAIRTAIIDDCTLGAAMKRQGPIWLGLTERAQSLRPYEGFAAIGAMVSRSAYAQLGYSPIMLAGVLAGLLLTFLAPVLTALFAPAPWHWAGLAAWLAMALSFVPMLRFYRLSPLRSLVLPFIGVCYGVFTLHSAIEVWRGRGGKWKGRTQAMAGGA